MKPRILVIQIRHDQQTREHEVNCIVKYSGLSRENFTTLDVFERQPTIADIVSCDALIVGGSGDYCVSEGTIPDVVSAIGELYAYAKTHRIPTLGICYGAHVMGHVFGGEVKQNVDKKEVGSYRLMLNKEAKNDPLVMDAPLHFIVQQGHKDGVMRLPDGAINLASTENWEHQMFMFPKTNMYAVQFHPELDVESFIERVTHYRNDYAFQTNHSLQKVIATLEPSPSAHTLLKNFFDRIVIEKMGTATIYSRN